MLFTIRDLIADAPAPVTVQPSDESAHARNLMLQNDYSQLPVVDAQGRSLGAAVTFKSILNALHNLDTTLDELPVDSVMTPAREVRIDADLLTVLDDIHEKSFLLIVDAERHLKGIVTTFDTTAHFRRYAEDLMVVEDIETMLRDAIKNLYRENEISAQIQRVVDKKRVRSDGFRRALLHYPGEPNSDASHLDETKLDDAFAKLTDEDPKSFDNLTFNELVEVLLKHPNCPTPMVTNRVAGFRKLLHRVRDTRNELAHFRGEVTAEQRDILRYCSDWLGRHMPASQETGGDSAVATNESDTAKVGPDISMAQGPSDESVASDDSTYAALAIFLKSQPAEIDARKLDFEEIERVIDYKLPKSARVHRAWWANDPTHVQAAQWLDVGWRAQNVNLSDERVTFVRTVEREEAYIHFFSSVLERLRPHPEFPLKGLSPQGVSWHSLAGFPWFKPNTADLNVSFTRQKTVRVELYLDTGDAQETKQGFNSFYARKEVIESELGPLSWERMDEKRASRVAIYRPGTITEDARGLEQVAVWVANEALKFYKTFLPHFHELTQ